MYNTLNINTDMSKQTVYIHIRRLVKDEYLAIILGYFSYDISQKKKERKTYSVYVYMYIVYT